MAARSNCCAFAWEDTRIVGMSQLWWQMPGPRRFCQRIAESLSDGKNVIIRLPAVFPEGLAASVRLLSSTSTRQWDAYSLRKGLRSNPAHMLFAKYARNASSATLRNAANLASQADFGRRIIWIEGLSADNWPDWCVFLQDYEHACRGLSELERTVFCVALTGVSAEESLDASIGLNVVTYRGIAGTFDTMLYTASIFPGNTIVGVKQRVAIAAIAQLALWDPSICEWMVKLPLAQILRPAEILRQFAETHGWNCSKTHNRWCIGTLNDIDGQPLEHASVCAIQSNERELNRRLWVAQISEIFPLLEQRRHELLRELTDYLDTPFQTANGEVIHNTFDLELGHIERQLVLLRRNGRRDDRLSQALTQVSHLKRMRNAIAHLKVLSEDDIVF